MERQVWTLLVLVASISCCKRKSRDMVQHIILELICEYCTLRVKFTMDFMHNF